MEYAGLYYGTLPNRAITISQLFTIHYFENFEDYFLISRIFRRISAPIFLCS